jgi:hypothetical protein
MAKLRLPNSRSDFMMTGLDLFIAGLDFLMIELEIPYYRANFS